MADIIHLLPDNIANQIAAGEVIQRPASVVKELIENAVDSGASKISLHIKDAGKTNIQIIDNGKGMSEMDAQMAFERHATSKLSSADDLFKLTTKGFRGEALASIAAIAHVSLETKEINGEIGTKIEIEGSKIKSVEPFVKNSSGTSVSVKNLFFNVPARRNFLKSDNIETKHIINEFYRIALTHPEIDFIFTHNGNALNNLESSGLRKRIVDLFGRSFNEKLVPIEEKTDIVSISGFILKPEFSKKTRGEQYFFVNKRFFKDNYLHNAVTRAYDNLIAPQNFPSYFIYLEVPKQSLDVNIHPTKTEVKFKDDRSIYRILMSSIKLALGKYNIAPSLDFERESQFDLSLEDQKKPIREPQININPAFNPFNNTKTDKPSASFGDFSAYKPLRPNKEEWENFYKITEDATEAQSRQLEKLDFHENFEISSNKIQIHRKYLLTQVKSGILLVDIKRANERILYDKLMKDFMLAPIVSQQLLFPYEKKLLMEQKIEWENNKKVLNRLGFNWEWKNNGTIILSSTPSILEAENINNCLNEIIKEMEHQEIEKKEIVHSLVLSLSKTAASINPKQLSEEEMNHLINHLFQSEQHQFSPSGKKIMNTILIEDLKKYL